MKTYFLKVLRGIVYFIGFPLLLMLTLITTGPMYGEPVFAQNIGTGIGIVIGMWAAIEIVRLILKLTCKKHALVQTCISVFVCVFVMLIPVVSADAVVGKKVDDIVMKNKDGVKITYKLNEELDDVTTVSPEVFNLGYVMKNGKKVENYNYQIGRYLPVTNKDRPDKYLTQKLIDSTDEFMRIHKMVKYRDYAGYKLKNAPTDKSLPDSIPSFNEVLENRINEYKEIIIEVDKYYNTNGELPTDQNFNLEKLEIWYYISDNAPIDYEYTKIDTKTGYYSYTYTDLLELRDELEIKPALYPYFVARNYIYMFIGIVAISLIGVDRLSFRIKDSIENPVEFDNNAIKNKFADFFKKRKNKKEAK